ncbi:hypothetical protein ACIBHX_47060 [Nonomuraea sp. NPDC050536]|uniref:hypothetical protein n=1 Tax=Nonomuraea sp. NPDC050536 TaxID=3364366 RepID=UPI0037C70A51
MTATIETNATTSRYIEGEYFVVVDVFTTSKPFKWLREEVLWHGQGVTYAEAQQKADEYRAHETPSRRVCMYQART